MNRLITILITLLLSNAAALACAAAYSFCTDCPEQQPVSCTHADLCATADVISSKPSNNVLDTTSFPIVYAGPPLPTGRQTVVATGRIAAAEASDLPPSLPLNLRFCVFLK
jgi:hypothetical protein